MNPKIAFTVLISAVISLIVAVSVCLAFFFFIYKPVQSTEVVAPVKTLVKPANTPNEIEPSLEIKASDISSLSIEPYYKEFYEEGSKCRQSYNDLYGDKDGYFTSNSPCRIKIVFNRDGSATKSLDLIRYDGASRSTQVKGSSRWTAKITDEQYSSLAKAMADNQTFKDWNDNVMINVVNCKIAVTHSNRIRTLMSNVTPATTAYLPLVELFKKLDSEVKWEKAQ